MPTAGRRFRSVWVEAGADILHELDYIPYGWMQMCSCFTARGDKWLLRTERAMQANSEQQVTNNR